MQQVFAEQIGGPKSSIQTCASPPHKIAANVPNDLHSATNGDLLFPLV